MCDFCHAPEHAYDVLLEDPELDRSGLCREAQERLLMAATPRPRSLGLWHYGWDEEAHDWRVQYGNHACLLCDAYCLHKPPGDDAWGLCRKCRKNGADRIAALRLHFDGAPLEDAEHREIATPPRSVGHPSSLLFNQTIIWSTRGRDCLPGPRAYKPARYPRGYLAGAKDPHSSEPPWTGRRRSRHRFPRASPGAWAP